jgi:hypothetical protein
VAQLATAGRCAEEAGMRRWRGRLTARQTGETVPTQSEMHVKLSDYDKRVFLRDHLAHRLILLTTFRDRQAWFERRLKVNGKDCDLLRVAKDAALISFRMFAYFLRLKPTPTDHDDGVFVEMLGGNRVDMKTLSPKERQAINRLFFRAHREVAHLTTRYDSDANTAEAIVSGIDIIERLLRTHLYDVVGSRLGVPFPDLEKEKQLCGDRWQFANRR